MVRLEWPAKEGHRLKEGSSSGLGDESLGLAEEFPLLSLKLILGQNAPLAKIIQSGEIAQRITHPPRSSRR